MYGRLSGMPSMNGCSVWRGEGKKGTVGKGDGRTVAGRVLRKQKQKGMEKVEKSGAGRQMKGEQEGRNKGWM